MQLTAEQSQTLTKRERMFFNEYMQDFDQLRAFRAVAKKLNKTYTPGSERQQAMELRKAVMTKLDMTQNDIFEAVGLTDERLAQKLESKLSAQRSVVIKDRVFREDDHNIQLKATEMVYKLKGQLSTTTNKVELTGADGGPMQLQVVAGIGFINNARTPNTRSEQNDATSNTSTVDGQPEIQSTDMASSSEENNNSN